MFEIPSHLEGFDDAASSSGIATMGRRVNDDSSPAQGSVGCDNRDRFGQAKLAAVKGSVVKSSPRFWVYLVVGVLAAGLVGYHQWYNTDARRLQRCIDASDSQMKQNNPELAAYDNIQPAFLAVSQQACKQHLGIN